MRKHTNSLITIIILTISLFSFSACMDLAPADKPKKSADIKKVSRGCGVCHQRAYKEWKESMHAKSAPSKNPLVQAFYHYMTRENIETEKCDRCHVPLRALYSGEKKKNEKLFSEGVNCLLCHTIRGKKSGKSHGIYYYRINLLKPLSGPSETIERIAHDSDFVPFFKEMAYCLGCHQNGEGDFARSEEMDIPCQGCHMPGGQNLKAAVSTKERKIVYKHLFQSGSSESFLKSGVALSGEARKGDGKTFLDITLKNTAPHTAPTGFPMGAMILQVKALDKDGETIWSNFETDPEREDPDSCFSLRFKAGEGIFAHWARDVKPLKDNRLEPLSERKLAYEVKSDQVAGFQAKLYYRILPSKVMKKLGIEEGLAPEVLMALENTLVN